MSQLNQFYLKKRLTTGNDIRRLVILTIVCAVGINPASIVISTSSIEQALAVIFFAIMLELYFLLVFFMPLALGVLGLVYYTTRSHEKKLEYGGYGYLAGFAAGFLLMIAVYGLSLGPLLGLAAFGFAVGIGLSFIAKQPKSD